MLTVTSATLPGLPGRAGWVQVFDRESLYVLIAGVNSPPPDQNFFLRFRNVYLTSSESSPLLALKGTIEKMVSEFPEGIEIAAAVFVNAVLYTVAAGGGRAEIRRGEISAKILDSHFGDRSIASASGYPKSGDVFLLLSGSGGLSLHFQTTVVPAFKPPAINFSKIKSWLPKPKLYVRPNRFDEQSGNKKREVTLMVGIILGILLLVSIVFGLRQKSLNDYRGKYQVRLDQAVNDYQQAVGMLAVEPQKARDLFSESRSLAGDLTAEKIKDPKLDQLVANLLAKQGQILGEYPTNPQVFMDLSIQTSGFVGTDMASSGETLFILDRSSKKIIQVEIATKKTQMAAGPDQIDSALGLAAYEDRVFMLNSTGVYELGDTKKQSIVKDWTGDVLIYAYAGNLYLLDKNAGVIWRYVGGDTGFAVKQMWLGTGVTPDFSGAINVTIDGSIYALTASGKIIKFSQGSPQNFNLPDNVNLVGAKAMYTNGDLQYFYILNPAEKKIYVVTKTGDYKGVYQSDVLGSASSLVVSEKDGKIIFLAGSKLYSIDIQNL